MEHEDPGALEDAVLSVLTGTPVNDAAARASTSPARLASAVERYRAAGRAALDTPPADWHQVRSCCLSGLDDGVFAGRA